LKKADIISETAFTDAADSLIVLVLK
jgi:hypothetical protein